MTTDASGRVCEAGEVVGLPRFLLKPTSPATAKWWRSPTTIIAKLLPEERSREIEVLEFVPADVDPMVRPQLLFGA